MAEIKDCSTNYMKALGLNQACMFTKQLKLHNNNYIVLIYSIGSSWEIYYSYKQKVYTFFLNLDNTDIND